MNYLSSEQGTKITEPYKLTEAVDDPTPTTREKVIEYGKAVITIVASGAIGAFVAEALKRAEPVKALFDNPWIN